MASIDLKADEEGLLEASRRFGLPVKFYPADELNEVDFPHPSQVVYRHTGAYGVSEPAAIKSANGGQLLVEKHKSGNVTISIALVNFAAEKQEVRP
jgi:cobalt-precorrin 5A hydrolase